MFPEPKLSSSQTIPESDDDGRGELVTCTHPSMTVAFVGTVNPSTTVGVPSLFIIDGPDQLETPANETGDIIISSVIAIASLPRSLGMLRLRVISVMNQSTTKTFWGISTGATGGN